MAKKKEDPIVTVTDKAVVAMPRELTGMQHVATITDGWTARLQREGYLLMSHPEHKPVMVELASIKDGDVLPRDTDERFEFPPAVEGQ